MREERSWKSEERVENYPQGFKNEWKINGCRVLVSTQNSPILGHCVRSLLVPLVFDLVIQ